MIYANFIKGFCFKQTKFEVDIKPDCFPCESNKIYLKTNDFEGKVYPKVTKLSTKCMNH